MDLIIIHVDIKVNSLRPSDANASLNWVIIGSDNGLSPVRRQAIIWTNARKLLIGPLETNFSEILIGIQTFSFKKEIAFENVVCKMASILSRPQWVNSC